MFLDVLKGYKATFKVYKAIDKVLPCSIFMAFEGTLRDIIEFPWYMLSSWGINCLGYDLLYFLKHLRPT